MIRRAEPTILSLRSRRGPFGWRCHRARLGRQPRRSRCCRV